ncbi:signal peptide peptidase domain-containing protein [Hirsutella rhossiliensis]|uniref:Signal peptide peptidase domain-containing protein n=1 Tax=Hirsutella rhossiliensis TaxID=111463 RepID=A0A9P8MXS6_9HYPO|nr:signal peptide peptidase domain-containing protein [Hirsutella rhossiliensis]KAH0964033.1 signal peptide peptidase domain-containing protein [Hirsutella rhossiliensis]
MSAEPTPLSPGGGVLDGVNATFNGTASAPGLASIQDLGFMLLELKLLAGALGIIYLGSHAALRRPPSASPAKGKKAGRKGDGDDDDDDDDDDERFSQGLEPTDAIMFPLLAAAMLVGLYYLIQWLKDPSMLNKILRWYMSTMAIASLLTLYAHAMELGTSLVFPRYWRARDGSLRRADQGARAVAVCDHVGNVVGQPNPEASPFPGPLTLLARSGRARKAAWEVRGLLTRHWVIRFFMHGVGDEKAKIRFAHMMALLLSLATALVYSSTMSPFLSNMLGYGMCYGSFLILSPTDFLTSSLVLVALFFYDIVMVFYTPYMITVATKLEVPIKLTFEAASRKSMLGLGDIVIPGMVIAWALRLDLWIHYMRRVKYESTELTIMERDAASGQVVSRSETKHKEVKARYVNVKGKWGDALWARGALFLSQPPQLPAELGAAWFRKPYFYAAMTGYALGMVCTLAMLLIFKQGQPALLYLVPGVLGSLVVTALARGEMKDVWRYTEDGSLDTMDVVVDLDGEGKAIKTVGKLENGVVDTTKDKKGDGKECPDKADDKVKDDESASKSRKGGGAGKKGHQVFLLSLEAPADEEDDDA